MGSPGLDTTGVRIELSREPGAGGKVMTGQVGEAVGPLPPIGPGDHSIGSDTLADPALLQHISLTDKAGKVCQETSDVI